METQAEQLKAIGTKLSETRQQKSLSLDEISVKTFIPLRLLNAIEAGRMEQLPEPVYIQGFIRRYADVLGLDGMAMSKQLSLEAVPPAVPTIPVAPPAPPARTAPPAPAVVPPVTQAAAPPPKPEVRQPVVPPAPVVPPETRAFDHPRDESRDERRDEPERKLPLIPIAAAIGLGALAFVMVNALNRPQAQAPATQNSPTTQPTKVATAPATKPASPVPVVSATPVASPKPTVSVSPSPAATASPSPSPAASPAPGTSGPVEVKLNVTEESWVAVEVDGEVVFEGTLPKGDQKAWKGKKQVTVSSGNAGGVSVSYNNAAAKPLGDSGDVKTVSFPPTP